MKGNPLLADGADVSLKRRWDDDTVFKNQARTAPKVKQRYINDAVRSDFHKKFLSSELGDRPHGLCSNQREYNIIIYIYIQNIHDLIK